MKYLIQSPLTNVLLFSIFWASEIFIAKIAFLNGAKVVQFSLQSFFLSLIILSLLVLPKKINNLKKIPFKILKWLLLANAILLGIGGFLGNLGIQLTTAVNAGFITQFTIVTTTFFAFLILKEKATITRVLSIIMIMIGTYFLITNGQLIFPHIGDLVLLFACIAWGLGPVLIKKVLKNTNVDPDIISFLRPVAGIPLLLFFILFSPFYPPSIQKIFQINIFEVRTIIYVILNAIFLSLTWIFANRSLKVASASYTVVMSSITPILVSLLATIFLREQIKNMQFIGILLIIASGIFTQYQNINKAKI